MAHTIKVDDVLVHTVTDKDIDVLKYSFRSANIEQMIIDLIVNAIENRVECSFGCLKKDGIPLLETSGATTISLDKDTLIGAILADPAYKDRDTRDGVI